nr:immunoglobulin heavy chain junction region [Macaca mulatta]MOW75476.1 immunoglobulin heavy chain junction region [Macaca mulatta]MOW75550.1 immunoglobulin heavy chain junction region [Macaca mulatta]MOW75623.1 immunoglobulin heavy chain junction region [Macaca mulatta]MOW75975.1 immunoglobulin heavy chain junction region [Macaca mulatta]
CARAGDAANTASEGYYGLDSW